MSLSHGQKYITKGINQTLLNISKKINRFEISRSSTISVKHLSKYKNKQMCEEKRNFF